ncbi:Putative Mn2+ efflux pump MntP [Bifidobacterium bohemicum]|uniref:Putative manganese efflux pump MntP n=1 Tax=Bifidobacterium bohemicum DSM 22767 TaxID=1437606 RepID=A0A086ZHH9_9BIFI|nr:manganese efflux pump MntP family protein [Bifidobacterium bohemicum]KFI45979.1 putative membrane protein [Bifidobacterium bohemicum DSM 22767]SCC03717.1 Putative Mn2+ efflux pump MntP [Bifidobacterium bohemicum]
MNVEILLIAISLSMDAFAVSISKGLAVRHVRALDVVMSALWMGGFQALFPLIGYFFASLFGQYFNAFGHWIVFALLAIIGGNMIREAFGDNENDDAGSFDWRHMAPLAVACSIDAFAIGVSFQFMTVNIWMAVAAIGVVCAAFTIAGLYLGHLIGKRFQKPAEILGGIILILLGVKAVLNHYRIL